MKPYGAGYHVMEVDLEQDWEDDIPYWQYAAERGLVLGCEYMLQAEARMDDIDQGRTA